MPSPTIDSPRRVYLCKGQPREGNDNRRLAQDVLVQGERREGNSTRRERHPAADQP
jgi:hypothetical protein